MATINVLIGLGIGAAVGGLVGTLGRCRSGTCPLTGSPISGAIWGAILGGLVVLILGPGEPSFASDQVRQITAEQEFREEVLAADRPVLVDFYTERCAACHTLAPTIGKLAEDYRGRAKVIGVDAHKAQALSRRYMIRAVPTVILFRGGEPVERWTGALPENVYRRALDSIIAQESAGPARRPTTQAERLSGGSTQPAASP